MTSYDDDHLYKNSENTKLFIGTEKILRRSNLQMDLLNFSTNPYSVNCEDVCQVNFIAVILNATNYCNESNTMDWACGLEELKRNFSYRINSFDMRNSSIDMINSIRTYSIRNPVDNEHLWLNCKGYDARDSISFDGVNSCINELHSSNFISQPYVYSGAIIVIIKIKLKEGSYWSEDGRIKEYYFTKLFWPPNLKRYTHVM